MNTCTKGTGFLRSGIAHAFLTFTCFGITNFLLGFIVERCENPAHASLAAPVVLWLGCGLLGMAFILSPAGRTMLRHTRIRGLDLIMAVAGGVFLAIGMLTLKLGFLSDPGSKGPITAVTAANAVLVALFARRLLGERLVVYQWAGILITVGGISVMGLSIGGEAALRGLLFGLATLACFGITNTLLKVLGYRGVPSMPAALIVWLSVGACGIAGIMILAISTTGIAGMQPHWLYGVALSAGVSLGIGMWSLKRGVTLGRAGPVVAIAGSNAVLVTIMDLAVFGHLPSTLKLGGMLAALAGVGVLAVSGNNIQNTPGNKDHLA